MIIIFYVDIPNEHLKEVDFKQVKKSNLQILQFTNFNFYKFNFFFNFLKKAKFKRKEMESFTSALYLTPDWIIIIISSICSMMDLWKKKYFFTFADQCIFLPTTHNRAIYFESGASHFVFISRYKFENWCQQKIDVNFREDWYFSPRRGQRIAIFHRCKVDLCHFQNTLDATVQFSSGGVRILIARREKRMWFFVVEITRIQQILSHKRKFKNARTVNRGVHVT